MRIRESVSAATYMEHTQVRPFVAREEHVETIDATIEKCLDLLIEQNGEQGGCLTDGVHGTKGQGIGAQLFGTRVSACGIV
jgi:hypothetical protein